jgi:hypothetical protein
MKLHTSTRVFCFSIIQLIHYLYLFRKLLFMALPPPLSAKDEKYVICLFLFELFLSNRSFAYETIKDRLPIIVTRIVDYLARHRARISREFGEVSVGFFTMSIICSRFLVGSRERMQIMYWCSR